MLDIIALAILLIAFAALINFVRSQRRPGDRSRYLADANKYHAVAIAKNAVACPAALRLVGRRFLSKEAPLLPVAGCTATPCRCRYMHYADRRSAERRFPFGVRRGSEPHASGVERRSSERRKAADLLLTSL